MISDGSFEEFICAFSNNNHYLNDPMILPDCKHSVCKNCIVNSADLKCKVCDKLVTKKIEAKNKDLKVLITKSANKLMKILEKQFNQKISRLKSICK